MSSMCKHSVEPRIAWESQCYMFVVACYVFACGVVLVLYDTTTTTTATTTTTTTTATTTTTTTITLCWEQKQKSNN